MSTPSIALASLSIRDFRGIESLDLDFRGPDGKPNSLVVLAGPNGSGKTAALEAALILCGGHKLAVGHRGTKAIRLGTGDYTISGEIVSADGTSQIEDDARSDPPAASQDLPCWYFSSWRAPRLIGPVDVTVGRAGRKPRKNDLNRLRNVKQILVNAAAMEHFPKSQQSFVSGYNNWMTKINIAWEEFYPNSGGFVVGLLDEPSEAGSGAFDVLMDWPPALIEIDKLSAGQLELFLFISALVLNDNREGIVFIDEPELHLDPQWHRPIIRCLTKLQPQAQFIVATHSPEIYDAARSYERHFLVPDDDPRARLWRRENPVEA